MAVASKESLQRRNKNEGKDKGAARRNDEGKLEPTAAPPASSGQDATEKQDLGDKAPDFLKNLSQSNTSIQGNFHPTQRRMASFPSHMKYIHIYQNTITKNHKKADLTPATQCCDFSAESSCSTPFGEHVFVMVSSGLKAIPLALLIDQHKCRILHSNADFPRIRPYIRAEYTSPPPAIWGPHITDKSRFPLRYQIY